MVKKKRWFQRLSILFLVAFFLISCSGMMEQPSKTEAESLRERVTAYWGYKIKKEFDKSYEYEYPLYKKLVPMVKYIKSFRSTVRWLDASIVNAKIEGDNAWVELTVKTKLILPAVPKKAGNIYNSYRKEKWIKVDGLWYHVPKKFLKKEAMPGN